MLIQDMLLAFIREQVSTHIIGQGLSEMEELEIDTTISYIFNENHDLEYILYLILDFFEENEKLKNLMPSVENYYINLHK